MPERVVLPAASEFEARVRQALERLGPGEVATYGEIAAEAGSPGAARAVGGLLARGGSDLAWWRVVTSTGRLVPGEEHRHAELLRAEGVQLRDGRVSRSTGHRPGPAISQGLERRPARPFGPQAPALATDRPPKRPTT